MLEKETEENYRKEVSIEMEDRNEKGHTRDLFVLIKKIQTLFTPHRGAKRQRWEGSEKSESNEK